jgi:hypothetical protein
MRLGHIYLNLRAGTRNAANAIFFVLKFFASFRR